VRRGDTVGKIAKRFGMTEDQLLAASGLRNRNRIYVGQVLKVVESPTVIAAARPSVAKAESARARAPSKSHPEALALLSPARQARPQPRPLLDIDSPRDAAESERIGQEASDAAEPGPGLLADPSDYSVARNGTIEVQASETLGHFAEWLGLRTSRLRRINSLTYGEPLEVHQRLKLDFTHTRPEEFEATRVDYHRGLQGEFFLRFEIEGTLTHRVGPGDSLWVLSHRKYNVPLWLLRQYNPDVNLESLTAGTPLTIPQLRERTWLDHDSGAAPMEATS
jgi:membrane-bound lytic murein transglycosylase D